MVAVHLVNVVVSMDTVVPVKNIVVPVVKVNLVNVPP